MSSDLGPGGTVHHLPEGIRPDLFLARTIFFIAPCASVWPPAASPLSLRSVVEIVDHITGELYFNAKRASTDTPPRPPSTALTNATASHVYLSHDQNSCPAESVANPHAAKKAPITPVASAAAK